MKVLLVTNALGGGAGRACTRLFEALRLNGIDVKLLHLEGQGSPDPDIVSFYPSIRDLFLRQITSFPLQVMRHMLMGDYRRNYRMPASIHKLEEHPLIGWADIVNLHWVPDFVHYRPFFKRIGRKPVVWTMHDMLPFSGGYHYESELPAERSSAIERRIIVAKKAAIAGANVSVVAPSSWLLGESKQVATFEGRLHVHIFNGLPLDVYKPIEKRIARSIVGLPNDRKIILFTADSVNSRRKGGHHLIEALGRLNHPGVTLVSVGRGRVEIDSHIDHIHMGGLSDDIAMALCYSSADIVAIPSIEDNSPNIIIESLACGRPLVAFNVGGISELVSSPELGVLVEDVSGASLAAGIERALATEFDARTIRNSASNRFDYGSLADAYSKLFFRLMSA